MGQGRPSSERSDHDERAVRRDREARVVTGGCAWGKGGRALSDRDKRAAGKPSAGGGYPLTVPSRFGSALASSAGKPEYTAFSSLQTRIYSRGNQGMLSRFSSLLASSADKNIQPVSLRRTTSRGYPLAIGATSLRRQACRRPANGPRRAMKSFSSCVSPTRRRPAVARLTGRAGP